MSGSNAKPIRVAVLAADGTLLGYVSRRPHNANWRMLGARPSVTLTKRTGARECVHNGAAWAIALRDTEATPQDMEAP